MMSDWRIATVAELQRQGIILVEDGNHGESRPRSNEFVDHGVAFIRAADMKAGRVLFESASKISQNARQRITKGIGAPGDVLISHKGTVGKVAFVPEGSPSFVCSPQTTFWRAVDRSVIDGQYLYAFLMSPEFHAQLRSRAGETDMAPYVSLTSQRTLSVALPPIGVQREIARVFGALDSKMELNRLTSNTLEALARTLFKGWFIDFDPVRAKSEGRKPVGMDAETAKLFPSRFEDSERGEIPSGWKLRSLGDCVALQRGTTYKSALLGRDGPRLLGLGSICRDGGFRSDSLKTYGGESPHKLIVRPGELYVSLKDVTQSGDLLGSVARLPKWIGLGRLTQDTVKLVFHGTPMPVEYIYWLLLTPQYREHCRSRAMGTTNLSLSREDFLGYTFAAPPSSILGRLLPALENMSERKEHLEEESRTLAELRDTLLPKLMSGELRIKDAEKIASTAL